MTTIPDLYGDRLTPFDTVVAGKVLGVRIPHLDIPLSQILQDLDRACHLFTGNRFLAQDVEERGTDLLGLVQTQSQVFGRDVHALTWAWLGRLSVPVPDLRIGL